MHATNRQKKLLSFFGIRFSSNISTGAAGWEIAAIMEDDANREKWRSYLYLTKDFDSDSPVPVEYDTAALNAVEIPEGWSSSDEIKKLHEEIVGQELSDGSPFDDPAPAITFAGKSFMFTGKLDFGTRKSCQTAMTERGGSAPSQKSISREIDYLVIGAGGSTHWKRGSYGNKIEAAIISRREHGTPAIISETDWIAQLEEG